MAKRVRRPWGWYRVLLSGKGWWIKRLVLKGKRTSLQSHQRRDELWLIFVPAGTRHRLSGRGEVMELALGDPKERDITRIADDYGRR